MKTEFILCYLNWCSFAIVFGEIYSPPETQITTVNASKTTIIRDNQTQIVVLNAFRSVELQCQASYPIMWAMHSLEQKWVLDVQTERRVDNLNDKSTYTYLMSVTLTNADRSSQAPGEFICHGLDMSRPFSVAAATVFWESGELPYWNYIDNNSSEGLTVYWARFSISPIIIPCYTLNENEVTMELFKMKTLKPFTAEKRVSQFKPYVGFIINSYDIASDHEVYECHAEVTEVITSNSSNSNLTGLNVIKQKSQYKRSFQLIRLKEVVSKPHTEILPFSSYLNQLSDNLTMGLADYEYSLQCCPLKRNNIILSRRFCTKPLLCLTKTKSQDVEYKKGNGDCARLVYRGKKNPTVYMCSFETSEPPRESKMEVLEIPEFATMYFDDGNQSNHVYFSFRTLNDDQNPDKGNGWNDQNPIIGEGWNSMGINPNLTFFTGEIVEFRCLTHPFYFSTGILWEIEFLNQTSTIHASNNTADKDVLRHGVGSGIYKLTINTDQICKIVCHVPQWNTSDWTTKTMPLNIRDSSAPTANGETMLYQNITLYDKIGLDSLDIECSFEGIPPPKLSWSSMSLSIFEYDLSSSDHNTKKRHDSDAVLVTSSRAVCLPTELDKCVSSPSYSERKFDLNDISWTHINETAITGTFNCTASNVAGIATKIFTINFIRLFPPLLANGNKEIVRPKVGDENTVLKCQDTQAVPQPTFAWQKHGMNISSVNNYEVRNFKMESHLVLFKISADDEGEFECTVKNIGGEAVKRFNVRVRDDPDIWHTVLSTLTCVAIFGLFLLFGYFLSYICKSDPKTLRLHEQNQTPMTTLPASENLISM